jgi:hypothetical protein
MTLTPASPKLFQTESLSKVQEMINDNKVTTPKIT